MFRRNTKRRGIRCPEETEKVPEARAPEQAGAGADPRAEAVGVAADLAPAPAGTVFARAAEKECRINWERLALSKHVLNVGPR